MKTTFHRGDLRRWSVPVRCVSRPHKIWQLPDGSMTDRCEMIVFATSKIGACDAAVDKIVDKYLRHQNKHTKWVVTGEPEEC
jgi:hypothetical protein